MPVGKGSIQRAQQIAKDQKSVKEVTPEEKTKDISKDISIADTIPDAKPAAKKKSAPKPAAPKSEAKKKKDLHQKQFEITSNITCELPTYLL